jgi:3-oxoisoapionate kinase
MTLLLAYYGDDFTGSTDVMEALHWSGLRTVLFLNPPTREQLKRLDNLRAFGVAGWSRTMSPQEMESELKPILAKLRDSGAPIVHYKVCSTFDSSPQIGSIGKALQIGREVYGDRCTPIIVGAPVLGRFQVFGNLFARSGLDTEPSRLDRHPTMKQHPITPMAEADLRLHLAQQTSLRFGLIDVLRLSRPDAAREIADSLSGEAASGGPDAVLFDVLDDKHLITIGDTIQRLSSGSAEPSERPLFVIGSSGVEYALSAYWNATGQIDSIRSHTPGKPAFDAVEQLVVVTGSCSPVNDRQIGWAVKNGFEELPLNPAGLVDPDRSDSEIDRSVAAAIARLQAGANIILHTSRGSDDPRVAETKRQYQRMGLTELDIKLNSGRTLGPKLGSILKQILQTRPMRRVAVAGGDTSGYVARELEIEALEAIAPVAPGSPLCRATASNSLDGLEIIFKGGQVGRDDVWGTLLKGTENQTARIPVNTT